jgi:type IV pilus assembly protein PilM
MAAQRLGWIGVDVGTHAVKLAQLARDGASVRLHRVAVLQRSTSWPASDRLGIDQPITSAVEIRAARQCGRFHGRSAVCLLPMNVCQLRGLCVPPGDEAERRAMIADELTPDWEEQGVAMEFDFWELEAGQADKGGDAFNVNALAISRPWVAQVSRDCRQAGLDCWVVDGAPLAMARASSLAGLASGRRALAIDWGFSNTTFCVVGDNRPWYTRRAAECGFGRALEAIVKKFDVAQDQAQHLADVYGVLPPASDGADNLQAQTAITEAVRTTVECLRDQARRTLQFLELQRRHLHPSAIWLMGGGASLRNVGPWLADELQLPVHIWSMPSGSDLPACAAGNRSAVFASAAALSALAWRAA